MLPLALILALLIYSSTGGGVLYFSRRIGADKKEFLMPKFRTMIAGTPVVPTHLLSDPSRFVTPLGSFLRKSSLDEIPQIWSVIKGDMSLVGPRPALYNQVDLISMREEFGINELCPGLTGWAQVGGRDALELKHKVERDLFYKERMSMLFDVAIIAVTFIRVFKTVEVSH